jgi:hypothetical protein
MPKLILFAACEKVLIDQATNGVTLISLLEEIHFKLPTGMALPPNMALPTQWAALTVWQEESADAGIEFEQKVTLEDATGRTLLENTAKFQFQQSRHRVVAAVAGIPYSRKLLLNLFYRTSGVPDWRHAASYPIEIVQERI